MPHTLFISDLHLCESRPAINEIFFRFLNTEATRAEALYILGDLFEYWIGDDDMDHGLNRQVVDALVGLSRSGTRVFFMHGNRDFLIGERFASEAGLTLLADPRRIDLYGMPILLMHGDTLCTDDVDYQRFRAMVRGVDWQRAFLSKPLEERRSEVEDYRRRSEQAKQSKSMEIMDVAALSVEETLRKSSHSILIHGHTHRPAHHVVEIDGVRRDRWVLPDWIDTAAGLRIAAGAEPVFFALP
jgi:UDP-2,3-diacylglucosamine hydrolase